MDIARAGGDPEPMERLPACVVAAGVITALSGLLAARWITDLPHS